MKPAAKHLHTAEGKLTQAAAMRGRLLKGVGIVKPRKRPAHFVWHRYRKEEADSAIRKHREDLKAQKIRLEKGKERMAALDVAPSAAGSSKATGTSASLPNNSNGVDITKDPTDSPEAEDEGGAVNKRSSTNLSDHQTHLMFCFSRLPHEEKLQWEAKASEDLIEAKEEYDHIVNNPPSVLPKDRQR